MEGKPDCRSTWPAQPFLTRSDHRRNSGPSIGRYPAAIAAERSFAANVQSLDQSCPAQYSRSCRQDHPRM